jgi:uncharacterized protein with von Willebrand factor type A (vWA) domain
MLLRQLQGTGHLASNIAHFARVLRRAGVPVAPGQVMDAQAAVMAVGLEDRDTLRAALAATLVKRHEHQAVFDQAFELYWQNPRLAEKMMRMLLPTIYGRTSPTEKKKPDTFARVSQALQAQKERPKATLADEQELEMDAALTFSDRDLLQHKDFEQLTLDELAQVRRELLRLQLPLPQQTTRRFEGSAVARRVDRRATLRHWLRTGRLELCFHAPRRRPAPLVVLADISGSMDRYARLLLLLLHRLSNPARGMGGGGDLRQRATRVESFVFGTRLTRITRELRHRDVDLAVARAAKAAPDWAGGTRLTSCLHEFNHRWARRVLGQGAVVLLISDGLDAQVHQDGAVEALAFEAERLRKSCSRLLWLNPLLRFDAFEAKPLGVRAVLPHVDAFWPVHNLHSLHGLAQALGELGNPRLQREWKAAARARLLA